MSKKVDLKVLNDLVAALNEQIALAEAADPEKDSAKRVVELSKALGLAGSISSEASFLIGDIAAMATPAGVVKGKKSLISGADDDYLGNLLGPAKKKLVD